MGDYTGDRTRYLFAGINVGSADVLRHIIGPKGKTGLLWDYGCQCVTTAFAGGTSTPKMSVGTVGSAAAYGAAFDFGAATVAGGSKGPRVTYNPIDTAFEGTYLVNRNLPADTVVMSTMVAATGGGAAGVGDFYLEVIWQD